MLTVKKVINFFALSLVSFTLIINLADLFYIGYYYKYFNFYNEKVVSDYYHPNFTDSSKIIQKDFKAYCLALKPDLFLPTYYALNYWSVLAIKISMVVLFAIFLIRKKEFMLENKYFIIALVVSVFLVLFISIIEPDYYFVFCGEYLTGYPAVLMEKND